MDERRRDALRVNFNRRLKLEFHGTKVTSDAGLLAYRDEDIGMSPISLEKSEIYSSIGQIHVKRCCIALAN